MAYQAGNESDGAWHQVPKLGKVNYKAATLAFGSQDHHPWLLSNQDQPGPDETMQTKPKQPPPTRFLEAHPKRMSQEDVWVGWSQCGRRFFPCLLSQFLEGLQDCCLHNTGLL